VTRTYQPFPLFNRTGSNLAFGVETGIAKLCDVLHQNTRTKFSYPHPSNRVLKSVLS
jgi:hypothetical protein